MDLLFLPIFFQYFPNVCKFNNIFLFAGRLISGWALGTENSGHSLGANKNKMTSPENFLFNYPDSG